MADLNEILSNQTDIVENKKEVQLENLIELIDESFIELITDMKDVSKLLREKTNNTKVLHNKVHKIIKLLRKNKKNKRDQKNKPSGFNKPILVSKELCLFLGIPEDELIARTNVTKYIHNYIKDNNLKNETDGRIINPDTKLKSLLHIVDEELTFFNLQKFLNIHFK